MIFIYLIDNSLIFYGIFIFTAGILSYFLYKSILYRSRSNTEINNINKDLKTTSNVYSDIGKLITPASASTVITELTPHEKKINEISEIYKEEVVNKIVDIKDITEIVNSFSVTDLFTSQTHGFIISMIETIISKL